MSEQESDKRDVTRRPLNYSLRYAKNIERKMIGEALGRLSRLDQLSKYRYVGFGSEFFNDFSLYHQSLGIRDMKSIESDKSRVERCQFNVPYQCIELVPGDSSEVLPQLQWDRRAIVWLDYVSKLDKKIIEDLRFVASRLVSGSVCIWTVNAQPWGGLYDEESGAKIKQSDWPEKRLKNFRQLFGSARKFPNLRGSELSAWGLAREFHAVIVDEIARSLNDRNASADQECKLTFRQCFHFRYADGQKMLTVGGIFVNEADSARLGEALLEGLPFTRTGPDAYELKPPILTGREIRFLSRYLPEDRANKPEAKWLSQGEIDVFKELYRYYPVFAESEL